MRVITVGETYEQTVPQKLSKRKGKSDYEVTAFSSCELAQPNFFGD